METPLKSVRPVIQAMKGYVPGEQPRGHELIKLNTNENPYRTSSHVDEAILRVVQEGLSRYPNSVGQAFRESAARLYNVEPNWILCGNGSDDILTIVTRTFVGEGELLRLPYPSYILYRSLAELQGADAEEIPFQTDWTLPDAFGLPADQTGSLRVHPIKARKLKMVYLPNPNSPSGTIVPLEKLEQFAKELPCPLLIDEAYADFAGSNAISLVKKYPNVMISRTLSKSYALAGLRFGFLIAQPDLIEQLIKVKDSYNCDAISIAAARAAIEDQVWLQKTRDQILKTRSRLTEGMRRLGFVVPDSYSNFTWNVHSVKSVSHLKIYEYLKEHGYLVRYMNYDRWGDGLRISVGTDPQIEECLALVEQSLTQN